MFEDYQFEWDPQKDEANLKKHGLSFERARTIWDDERRYVIRSANRFDEACCRASRPKALLLCRRHASRRTNTTHLSQRVNKARD